MRPTGRDSSRSLRPGRCRTRNGRNACSGKMSASAKCLPLLPSTSYLLDTSILAGVLFLRRHVTDRFAFAIAQGSAVTGISVYGEVTKRLLGTDDAVARRRELRTLPRRAPALPVRPQHVERYAELRRAMRRPHGPGLIGDIDTLIAAAAIEHDLTLATMDGDFERVPGLKVLLVPRR